jgi:glycyl-tRNA synthetase
MKRPICFRKKLNTLLNENDLEGLYNLILEYNIVCPLSNTANWTPVKQFNCDV